MFNLIYYLAGGVGKNGEPYIYSIIDWRDPGPTMAYVFMVALAMVMSHVLILGLTIIRKNFRLRLKNSNYL